MEETPIEQNVGKVPASKALGHGVARGLNTHPGSDDDGWEVTGPVTLADGTTVRLLKDGEALHSWYESIDQARHSIFVETYIFADDQTGRAFKQRLMQKARSGVRVFVIYDSFGSASTDRGFFDEMRAAGVHVSEFHPMAPWRCSFSWRPFNRNHRKLLIIDGHFAGLGGLNIANEYGGSWVTADNDDPDELWRDCGISLEGPGVEPFATAFRRSWLYVAHGGPFSRALTSHNLEGTQGPIGLLCSVPSMGSQMSRLLASLLRKAQHSIDLTMAYFAPGDELVRLLCAASHRGVRIRLMLPSVTDVPLIISAARSFYEQMLGAGITIYERQHVTLHAKTLVIDDRISVLGSTNFDYRSIDYNCELAAVIHSEEFGAQMEKLFEHDVQFSVCVNPKVWRHRPFIDRFVQWAVARSRTFL